MNSILVTGGAGFIGANFIRYWRNKYINDQLIIIDALTYAGSRMSLNDVPDIKFVHGDIRDGKLVGQILSDFDIDTIVHFAAESHVDRSISGPDAFIDTNIIGTHNLLKQAKSRWLDFGTGKDHRFHHVSTDEVYGTLGPGDPAFSETTAYAPNSPYSATKAASDHLVRAYHHTYGLNVTTSNCSNNYGPFQFPEKLIPLFLLNILHGKKLPIYGDGQQVRDWLYVEDHCRAIDLVLKRGRLGETYNIGGGEELTNLMVIDTLCELVDETFSMNVNLSQLFPDAPPARGQSSKVLKEHIADRPGHDRRYAINEEKARSELGYTSEQPFVERFRETINWYIEKEKWWRAILDRTHRVP